MRLAFAHKPTEVDASLDEKINRTAIEAAKAQVFNS